MIIIMSQGRNCRLCDSPGTNKATCPLNPNATKPNYTSHHKAREQLGAVAALSKRSPPPVQRTTCSAHSFKSRFCSCSHE